jgi:hypothetical protein
MAEDQRAFFGLVIDWVQVGGLAAYGADFPSM